MRKGKIRELKEIKYLKNNNIFTVLELNIIFFYFIYIIFIFLLLLFKTLILPLWGRRVSTPRKEARRNEEKMHRGTESEISYPKRGNWCSHRRERTDGGKHKEIRSGPPT